MKTFKRILAFIMTAALVFSVCAGMFTFSAEEKATSTDTNNYWYMYYLLTSKYGSDVSEWPVEAWYWLYSQNGDITVDWPIMPDYTTPSNINTEVTVLAMSSKLASFVAPYYWWGEATYQWQQWNGWRWVDIDGATGISINITNPVLNTKYRVIITTKYAAFASKEVVISGIADTVAPKITVNELYSYDLGYGSPVYYVSVNVYDASGIATFTIDGETQLDSKDLKSNVSVFYTMKHGTMPTIIAQDAEGNKSTVVLYIDDNTVKVLDFSAPTWDDNINSYPGYNWLELIDRSKLAVTLKSHTAEKAVLEAPESITKYGSYLYTYQWQIASGTSFVNIKGATGSTLTIDKPVEGAIYRVRITSRYTGGFVDSPMFVIPALAVEEQPEVKPEDKPVVDEKFSVEDIVISGVPTEAIEAGDLLILNPQPLDGTWVFDSNYFSGMNDGITVLKSLKGGVTVLKYRVERNGKTYEKSFIITINETVEEVGTLDD